MVSQITPQPAAAESVLAGLLARQHLADVFHVSTRTIIRWERAGMPFIAMGMVRLYDPAKVRGWLMSHEQQQNVPKRGRPAGKRAA
jgi:phage terminase Nu1 subunit (DNA packaging protein)